MLMLNERLLEALLPAFAFLRELHFDPRERGVKQPDLELRLVLELERVLVVASALLDCRAAR